MRTRPITQELPSDPDNSITWRLIFLCLGSVRRHEVFVFGSRTASMSWCLNWQMRSFGSLPAQCFRTASSSYFWPSTIYVLEANFFGVRSKLLFCWALKLSVLVLEIAALLLFGRCFKVCPKCGSTACQTSFAAKKAGPWFFVVDLGFFKIRPPTGPRFLGKLPLMNSKRAAHTLSPKIILSLGVIIR